METTGGLTKRLAFDELGAVDLAGPEPEALIQALRHPTVEGFSRCASRFWSDSRRQPLQLRAGTLPSQRRKSVHLQSRRLGTSAASNRHAAAAAAASCRCRRLDCRAQ